MRNAHKKINIRVVQQVILPFLLFRDIVRLVQSHFFESVTVRTISKLFCQCTSIHFESRDFLQLQNIVSVIPRLVYFSAVNFSFPEKLRFKSNMNHLQELRLKNFDSTAFLKCTSLRKLKIAQRCSENNGQLISNNNNNLQRLHLAQINLKKDTVQSILNCTSLIHLKLLGNEIKDKASQLLLFGLNRMTQLKTLALQDQMQNSFASFVPSHLCLTRFSFEDDGMSKEGLVNIFVCIQEMTSLRTLKMVSPDARTCDDRIEVSLSKLTGLTRLHLQRFTFGMCFFATLQKLEHLKMHCCKFKDLYFCSALKTLHAEEVTWEQFEFFDTHQLQKLYLTYSKNITRMERMLEARNLTFLYLFEFDVLHQSKLFAFIEQNTRLETLVLTHVPLGNIRDFGLKHLSMLDVSNCDLDSSCFAVLKKLRLKELAIHKNEFGLKDLVDFVEHIALYRNVSNLMFSHPRWRGDVLPILMRSNINYTVVSHLDYSIESNSKR